MDQLNSSVTPNISSSDSLNSSGLIPAVLMSFCCLLGVAGNIAVIILRPNWQHLSDLSQSLMLNLAISDLLILLPLPLWIYTTLYNWPFGLVTCKLLKGLIYTSLHGSLLTVTVLSVQRYLQVVRLQKFFDKVGKKWMLLLIWVIAVILSIPSSVAQHLSTNRNWITCETQFSSSSHHMALLLAEIVTGFVALTVVLFSYISLHRKVNQGVLFNHPQTTRLVTSIIMTFFVFWMPYHVTSIVRVSALSLNNGSLLKSCMDNVAIIGGLIFVNSFLNPLLYAFAARNKCTVCQRRNMDTVVNA